MRVRFPPSAHMKLLWILINCNTRKEAQKIGSKALEERLAVCFDIFSRIETRYFWPPKTGKIEKGKGCLLILETLPAHVKKIEKLVRSIHSDNMPFVGSIEIGNVRPEYIKWMQGEIQK